MISLVPTLAGLGWDPGFRGILTVVVGVVALMGSVTLIVSTNSGARLGFLLSVTALAGWMVVMGIVWTAYGIGPKGRAPMWRTADVVEGSPSNSRVEVARSIPSGYDRRLPDPIEVRDNDKQLLKDFPPERRAPTLADLADSRPAIAERVNRLSKPWKLLQTSNRYTGEVQAVVAEEVGPDGLNLYPDANAYVVLNGYLTGGKSNLGSDTSTFARVRHRIASVFELRGKPFYTAVQVQAVIPQTTKPGQAPPTPVADTKAPVYTVILKRDRGELRLPAFLTTVASGIIFALGASALHRRDKLATRQRAATAGAA